MMILWTYSEMNFPKVSSFRVLNCISKVCCDVLLRYQCRYKAHQAGIEPLVSSLADWRVTGNAKRAISLGGASYSQVFCGVTTILTVVVLFQKVAFPFAVTVNFSHITSFDWLSSRFEPQTHVKLCFQVQICC